MKLCKHPSYVAAKLLAKKAHPSTNGVYQRHIAHRAINMYQLHCSQSSVVPRYEVMLRIAVAGMLHDIMYSGEFGVTDVAVALSRSAHKSLDPMFIIEVIGALGRLHRRDDEDLIGHILSAKTNWLSRLILTAVYSEEEARAQSQEAFDTAQLALYILRT